MKNIKLFKKALGFTLTEILVAAVIISTVAGFTVFAHSFIHRQMIYSEHRYAALFLAQGKLDDLLHEDFAPTVPGNLANGPHQIVMLNSSIYQNHALAGFGGVIDYTVTDLPVAVPTRKEIALTVSWQENNSAINRQVLLQGIITDYKP